MREEIIKLHNQLFEEREKDRITIVSVIGSLDDEHNVVSANVLTGGETQHLICMLMTENLDLAEIIFESASFSGMAAIESLKRYKETPSQ